MKARSITLAALFGAMLFIVQVVAAPLPNIELVTTLTMVFSQKSKKMALGAVGIFVLLEGLLYGFGHWWISYLYVWPLLVLITPKSKSPLKLAIIALIFGLAFGTVTAPPFVLLMNVPILPYIAAGWWFDIVHGVGNYFAMLILYKPLSWVLEKAGFEKFR